MTKTVKGQVVEAIIFHVDDVIHSAASDSIYRKFLVKMQKKFPLKDLGRPQKFLGLYFENIPNGSTAPFGAVYRGALGEVSPHQSPYRTRSSSYKQVDQERQASDWRTEEELQSYAWSSSMDCSRSPLTRHRLQCDSVRKILCRAYGRALEGASSNLRLPQRHCEFWARLRPHSRRGKVATQSVC